MLNKLCSDVLLHLQAHPYTVQRALALALGCSLGAVNEALRTLCAAALLDDGYHLTDAAYELLAAHQPRNAILLAAGTGIRMVPIHSDVPKALIQVHGQTLIERLIHQLQAVGIRDITVVVGYQKERFEPLMDAYDVRVVVNPLYAQRNNLHSLALVASRLDNTYVVPCDLWCKENPFATHELYPWYMMHQTPKEGSPVRIARGGALTPTRPGETGHSMLGIAYFPRAEAQALRAKLLDMDTGNTHAACFWEDALLRADTAHRTLAFPLLAHIAEPGTVHEINTYEQLRQLDPQSLQLRSPAIDRIADALGVPVGEIENITALKKGMTNRSFLFSCGHRRYIFRIPGEGTDKLINRYQEHAVYRQILGQGLCEEVLHLDPAHGYKLSVFLPGARTCDPNNARDVSVCMALLRQFHEKRLSVEHTFDLFEQLAFYAGLRDAPSAYADHGEVTAAVLALRPFIEDMRTGWCLTHIDAVPDNFLFVPDGEGQRVLLIDWEYAGMQDPHVDVAMFAVYALYDRGQVDMLIDAYFGEAITDILRTKVYAYIAVCGLLWSNWCEYKQSLGVEFGEYALQQYRFAKEYAHRVHRLLRNKKEEGP